MVEMEFLSLLDNKSRILASVKLNVLKKIFVCFAFKQYKHTELGLNCHFIIIRDHEVNYYENQAKFNIDIKTYCLSTVFK